MQTPSVKQNGGIFIDIFLYLCVHFLFLSNYAGVGGGGGGGQWSGDGWVGVMGGGGGGGAEGAGKDTPLL